MDPSVKTTLKNLLLNNGWICIRSDIKDEMDEYVLSSQGNTVGIEIALDAHALGCYGYYGVCSVNITAWEYSPPYIRDDLSSMLDLIYKTEWDLLKLGIPFRPTYAFGKHTEHQLGLNLDLRKKYELDKYENED